MKLSKYQELANQTAHYPGRLGLSVGDISGLLYTGLGIAGESGEFADKVKKILRDNGGKVQNRDALLKELGDVLWYVTQNAQELGSSLGEVAQMNIDKLNARQQNGTIGGSGDNR